MKNLKKLGKVLGKKEQSKVKGGYIPTPYQYCCTHSPGFWQQQYPNMDASYFRFIDCNSIDCRIDGNPYFDAML